MAQDVVGPTGSLRRRWATFLSLVLVVGVGVAIVMAVHDTGRFQLDGDAATSTSAITPPVGFPVGLDDWDKVCNEVTGGGVADCGTNATTTGPAKALAWTTDNLIGNGPSTNATIFTGGGSKDPSDVNQWAWKDGAGGLPDKDNLVHGFAARYSLPPTDPATNPTAPCPNGTGGPGEPTFDPNKPCDVLFFGSDRFDNSGDAQQGFWFFQGPVSTGIDNDGDGSPDEPCPQSVGGGTGFCDPNTGDPATHRVGDLLIISDFSNGGTTSTITIYSWDPTCLKEDIGKGGTCGDANLRRLRNLSGANANCATAGSADIACGLVNPSLITMPWSFTDKSNTANNGALNGEFFEAGVNLSVLNLQNECFSSIGAETRSSTSTTAVLKDFILGQFAVCAPTLSTQATTNGTVAPGVEVKDRATVLVTGATNPADPLGTVTFHLCGPNASAAPDCSTGGTLVGSAVTLSNADCSPVSPNDTDGKRCALSAAVNGSTALSPGFYCFRASADLTNYADPAEFTNTTTECFRVADTTTTTTAQRWLPNDEATVLKGTGGAASGTVVFTLYPSANCTGTPLAVFDGPTHTGIPLDGNGKALTNNTSIITTNTTISWRVVFTSSDANVGGSTSHCETSTVTINNDIGS